MQSRQSTVKRGFSTLWIIVAVAIVGVVAVLAFGVLDFYKIKKPDIGQKTQVEEDQQVQNLNTLSTSDEVDVIEKDLDLTNLDALDAEIGDVARALSEL